MFHVHRTKVITLFALIMLVLSVVAWQPHTTHAAGGGTAYFTDGGYASRTTTYKYIVDGAPPNVCGTLHITRNAVPQPPTPGWICTDGNGHAEKGPWGPPTSDETATAIYISWPDGSVTNGGDTHINDVTDPVITINQSGGTGVPIPSSFSGMASDAQWGTGFRFTYPYWSNLSATFYNVSTQRYYGGGSSYSNSGPVYWYGSGSDGFNTTWSDLPPPSYAHNSTDTYRWCITIRDRFYATTRCIYFYGPR